MSGLLRFCLITLVALWLPVTLHCSLEAAGLLADHNGLVVAQAMDPCSDCSNNACPAVEDSLYKESAQELQVATLQQTRWPAFYVPIPPDRNCPAESPLSPLRHAPPRELGVTWQFVTRAALPARAPSPIS